VNVAQISVSAFCVNCRQIPQVLEAIVKLIQQEDSVSSNVKTVWMFAVSFGRCSRCFLPCGSCSIDFIVFVPYSLRRVHSLAHVQSINQSFNSSTDKDKNLTIQMNK